MITNPFSEPRLEARVVVIRHAGRFVDGASDSVPAEFTQERGSRSGASRFPPRAQCRICDLPRAPASPPAGMRSPRSESAPPLADSPHRLAHFVTAASAKKVVLLRDEGPVSLGRLPGEPRSPGMPWIASSFTLMHKRRREVRTLSGGADSAPCSAKTRAPISSSSRVVMPARTLAAQRSSANRTIRPMARSFSEFGLRANRHIRHSWPRRAFYNLVRGFTGSWLLLFPLRFSAPSRTVFVPWYVWCSVAAVTCAMTGIHWDISWHRSDRARYDLDSSPRRYLLVRRAGRPLVRLSDSLDYLPSRVAPAPLVGYSVGISRAAGRVYRRLGRDPRCSPPRPSTTGGIVPMGWM